MTTQEKFGHRVKELRLEKKLSQDKLAQKAEISRTFLQRAERGRRTITIEPFSRILKVLEISCEDFFAGGLMEDPQDWDEWDILQSYVYFEMVNIKYLNGDQPTTCGICGRRVHFVFFFGPLMNEAILYQCPGDNCREIFMAENEYGENPWEYLEEASIADKVN